MRTKLMLAAAVAGAATFVPVQSASAFCDLRFYQATGYCNPCLLVAAHSQRPEPLFCPL